MAFVYHLLFCDESGKYHNPNDPLIAFAGVCVTPDRLDAFNSTWGSLLRSYELPALHMKKASRLEESIGYRLQSHQTVDERTDLLLPFADCINKHLEMGYVQAWDVKGFNSIQFEAKQLLGGSSDPFYWAFVRGLLEIVDKLGEDDRISVICDDDVVTAWDAYCHYRAAGKAQPTLQKKAISLTFADDVHFPALQAADMVAFLAKHEAQEKFFGIPNMWRRLYDRTTTEPSPSYGLMRWWFSYNDQLRMLNLANSLKALLEERKSEKQKRQRDSGVRKLRQNNAAIDERSPQPDKSRAGRRKTREAKRKKAEG